MRIAHRLRPGEENDFTVDKADAFVAFWKQLTSLLFTAIPAVVAFNVFKRSYDARKKNSTITFVYIIIAAFLVNSLARADVVKTASRG